MWSCRYQEEKTNYGAAFGEMQKQCFRHMQKDFATKVRWKNDKRFL